MKLIVSLIIAACVGYLTLLPCPHNYSRLPGRLQTVATCLTRFIVWSSTLVLSTLTAEVQGIETSEGGSFIVTDSDTLSSEHKTTSEDVPYSETPNFSSRPAIVFSPEVGYYLTQKLLFYPKTVTT